MIIDRIIISTEGSVGLTKSVEEILSLDTQDNFTSGICERNDSVIEMNLEE